MEQVKHRTARSLIYRLTTAPTTPALSSVISEIRLISKLDPEIRSLLAGTSSDLIPILTHLLLLDDDADDEFNRKIQEDACATLLNLSISCPESLMSTPSLLPSLSRSLANGSSSPVLAQHAAATLYSLLSVESYRPIIGSKASIISPLISILKAPSPPTRSIKDSLKALFGIALYPLNRPRLIELGIVPALFGLVMRDGRTGIVEDTTAVVAQVAGCVESVDGFGRVGGVRILVGLVGDYGDEGRGVRVRENAVSALLNMVMSGGERAVEEIREVEMAEVVVRELVESGSERGRRKGMELLKVLEGDRRAMRRSWEGRRDSDYGFSGGWSSVDSNVDSTSSF